MRTIKVSVEGGVLRRKSIWQGAAKCLPFCNCLPNAKPLPRKEISDHLAIWQPLVWTSCQMVMFHPSKHFTTAPVSDRGRIAEMRCKLTPSCETVLLYSGTNRHR